MKSILSVSLLLLSSALAQTTSPLSLRLSQDLVSTVVSGGRTVEKITPMPAAVSPGDLLAEQLSASNIGRTVLRNAVVRLNVPAGTRYSAPGPASDRWKTEFSIDNGKTFAPAPLMKTISVTENGKTVQRKVVVSPSEYTAVRWIISTLSPDETLKLGFRVTVK